MRHSVALICLLCSPALAKLPDTTPKQLAKPMGDSYKRYAVGRYQAIYSLTRNAAPFGAKKKNKALLVKTQGKFAYASDGLRWIGSYSGANTTYGKLNTSPYSWQAGYDGKAHFTMRQPSNIFVWGQQQAHEGIPTQELFWSSHGRTLPDSLARYKWTIKGQQTIADVETYHLERVRNTTRGGRWRHELYLAPNHSYLPVLYKVFYKDKLSFSHELMNLRKAKNGMWFPRKVRYRSPRFHTRLTVIRKFDPDPQLKQSEFKPELPWGAAIVDQRSGFTYRNDPWYHVIKPVLKRHKWPQFDYSPLSSLRSYIDKSMKGARAPKIQVSQWIANKPKKLRDIPARVRLVYLSSVSLWQPFPKYTTALKELYKKYQPHGLEIIQVHQYTRNVDKVRRGIRELQIPWPVAIDVRQPGGYGKTYKAYKATTYHSPVLVDKEGNIRMVDADRLAIDLKQMLENAGAKDVPYISMKIAQNVIFRPLEDEIKGKWRAAVLRSTKTSKIAGKIVGQGDKPLAGARVSAQLIFELSHMPYATRRIYYTRTPLTTVSGKDGAFDLSALSKGTYLTTVSSPGHKPVTKKVYVGKTGHKVSARFALPKE